MLRPSIVESLLSTQPLAPINERCTAKDCARVATIQVLAYDGNGARRVLGRGCARHAMLNLMRLRKRGLPGYTYAGYARVCSAERARALLASLKTSYQSLNETKREQITEELRHE